nr:MAG TPA: FRG domain [Caudoviricetes sp.]
MQALLQHYGGRSFFVDCSASLSDRMTYAPF